MAKNLKSFLTKKYPSAFGTEILNEVEWLNTGIPTLNYVISGRPFSGGFTYVWQKLHVFMGQKDA